MRRCATILALGLAACAGDDGPEDATLRDAGPGPVDGGVDTGAPEFALEVIEGLGSAAVVGDFARVAVDPSGRFTVAYGYTPPGGQGEREIHFAISDGPDAWQTEVVTRPGEAVEGGDDLRGLGLAYVGGDPHVVFLGGDDDGRATVEEPTDLVMGVRSGGQWRFETLVDVSTEATGDCSEYCNEGFVVGSYATIAADPTGSGFAVVYRDTHLGFATDDLNQADVEAYIDTGGGVAQEVVDAERSGGAQAAVAYTPDGRVVTAYNVEFQPGIEDITGIWAAVRDGGAWTRVRVWEEPTAARISLAAAPDGTLYMAFSDSAERDLVVATSSDGGETWQTERVDSPGATGLHPSLAFDGEGRAVVAYGYCGPASDRDCPQTLGPRAEVRLARAEAGGWATYLVSDGEGNGRVGFFNTLAVAPDGTLGVAFFDDANGDLLFARQE